MLPGLQRTPAFILHSMGWLFVASMRWPLAVSPCRISCPSILPANGCGAPTVCQPFPRSRPSNHTKPQPGAPAASHAARREGAAARWRPAPAHRPGRGGRPPRRRGRSGRRRGSRRRLCDFGFDLPGDELIPLYNRLRGDRKMAARYLRRHGDHRARAGRGLGKIQPLWRRVSLTARTAGGGLGSVAPAAGPWRRAPRAGTGTPGLLTLHSRSPGGAPRPERPSRPCHSKRPAQGLHSAGSSKARSRPSASPRSLHTRAFRARTEPQSRPSPEGPSTGAKVCGCAPRGGRPSNPAAPHPPRPPPELGVCRPSRCSLLCTRLPRGTRQPRASHEVTCGAPSRRPRGGRSDPPAPAGAAPHACARGARTRAPPPGALPRTLTASLARGLLLADPRVPPNTLGRAGAHTRRPASPPRALSACPSARGSVVVNAAFDGGRICCARSERAAIIWKAEIRNTIYSAALWKQFPALYNPILGQPPGAGQITIGYSLSSPGTKISRPR